MKILVYRWDIYPYDNIIDTLTRQGHQTDVLAFSVKSHIEDEDFSRVLEDKIKESGCELVFSVNFYAVIAKTCFRNNVRYAAWTCDTPLLSMLHPSVFHPTNYIFTFDKMQYEHFKKQGLDHIYYLPLAGAPATPLTENARSLPQAPRDKKYYYDVTFIGSLYEKNRYDEIYDILPDNLCGYLDAIIEAGKRISGGNFISRMLTDEILSQISQYVSVEGNVLSDSALKIHVETAVLSYKIAAEIRTDALWLLSQSYNTHLFTSTPRSDAAMTELSALNNLHCHPPVDYQTKLPDIFRRSKINLNFTIPNIQNGIPLRVFDILSSGGFLLTDCRDALYELFEDGKDLVVFDGMSDMIEKAGHYLTHPSEREQIARSGMEKVHRLHTYDHRIREILRIIKTAP